MKVAIIGGTGLIGSQLIERLLTDSHITGIVSIVRRGTGISNPKYQEVLLEDFAKIENLDISADFFVCCIGTTIKVAKTKENFRKVDYEYVVAFSKLAERKMAKALFVVSSLGANSISPVFYSRVKGEIEEEVLKRRIACIYILRPSMLIGERAEKRFGEEVGIQVYKKLSGILPKVVKSKLGTEVVDIVNWFSQQFKQVDRGHHIITDFSKHQNI